VPDIAQMLKTNRNKHDGTAREWCSKYAMWVYDLRLVRGVYCSFMTSMQGRGLFWNGNVRNTHDFWIE
jgi:hypothetical protein